MNHIKENLNKIKKKINQLKKEKNLTQDIKLIAVSKNFPSTYIIEAYQAGQLIFGENKVQEGVSKRDKLKEYPVQIHLIGHLQSNKARKAAAHFNVIHSIDNLKTVEKISNYNQEFNQTTEILIQINTSGENSKSGLEPDINVIKKFLGDIKKFPGIKITGFMTIGPLTTKEEDIRKSFTLLRTIRDKMQNFFPNQSFTELSMGMSNDFEIAIEEGATYIRVGSAIFGNRNYI